MGENNIESSLDEALERKNHQTIASLVSSLPSTTLETRKACLQQLKTAVTDEPTLAESVVPACERLLVDDDRSVRLTTAKLFVTVAEATPDAVLPAVSSLADRLADDEEFYYVRARSAEALGYVALEHPEEVTSPEVLADLRVGLTFDEPEVKQKLAKALEFVAVAHPKRLRHQVSSLAEHLDDEEELVRYHLTTALVAVGCAYPDRLAEATDELTERLADETPQVRGRAAEALGVADTALSSEAGLEGLTDDDEAFVSERARFALDSGDAARSGGPSGDLGSTAGLRRTTTAAVEEITSPDADGACPHCGLALPEDGPQMCPRCGVPR